jgi:hypothetical protein
VRRGIALVPGGRRLALPLAAALALGAGVAVYAVARPPGSAALIPAALAAGVAPGPWAGPLPTLLHAFAFALLAGALARTRRGAAGLCGLWLAVEAALEAGQADGPAAWLAGLPLPEAVTAFFRAGTFDPLDLAAAALGAAAALALVHTTRFEEAPRVPAPPASA